MNLKKTRLALGLIFAIAAPFAHAADEHFLADGAAVGGYDVVAYHTQNGPALGSADFTAVYQGVEWRFASAANRELFAADPAKYAPAYGGWCSAGASKGQKGPHPTRAVRHRRWSALPEQLSCST
ncbi:MAG: YHS domain-containing (seleno)protein [Paracoccaceae bacterium]|nr:YHS domain-containing (seleno)protein [Paracoccaceae bacterium]